jgi:transcriptional regulator with XRE-family HTH domain
MQSESTPFAPLGMKLKSLRKQMKETVAEAAGAVEISEEDLREFERGIARPSEEILMLLINHFGMQEDEAVTLWEMAGYDGEENNTPDEHNTKSVVIALTLDPRIVYSDTVQVNGSKHGVVLNFMQPGGGHLPSLPVSRVGMSRDQAKKLAELIQETLGHLDAFDKPKQLPESTDLPGERAE